MEGKSRGLQGEREKSQEAGWLGTQGESMFQFESDPCPSPKAVRGEELSSSGEGQAFVLSRLSPDVGGVPASGRVVSFTQSPPKCSSHPETSSQALGQGLATYLGIRGPGKLTHPVTTTGHHKGGGSRKLCSSRPEGQGEEGLSPAQASTREDAHPKGGPGKVRGGPLLSPTQSPSRQPVEGAEKWTLQGHTSPEREWQTRERSLNQQVECSPEIRAPRTEPCRGLQPLTSTLPLIRGKPLRGQQLFARI